MSETLKVTLGKGAATGTKAAGKPPAEPDKAKAKADSHFDELETAEGAIKVRVCVLDRSTPPEKKPHTLSEVRIQGRG